MNGNSYWKCSLYNCKTSCAISSFNFLIKTNVEHIHGNILDKVIKSDTKKIYSDYVYFFTIRSYNKFNNDTVRNFSSMYSLADDIVGRIISFDGMKSSIYSGNFKLCLFLISWIFLIFYCSVYNLKNGRSFFVK